MAYNIQFLQKILNKFLLPLLFAITFTALSGNTQSAFAGVSSICPSGDDYCILDDSTGGSCEGFVGDGPIFDASWDDATNTCSLNSDFEFGLEESFIIEQDTTLENNANMVMKNTAILDIFGTFIVNAGAVFTADEPDLEINNISSGGGTTIIIGGSVLLGVDTILDNTDDEIIILPGGSLTNEGLIINDSEDTIHNCGIFTVTGTVNPLGTINNYIGGTINGVQFNNLNLVCPFGSAIQAVAGELIPLETTSLLIASMQSNMVWLLPAVIAGVGFTVFKLKRY